MNDLDPIAATIMFLGMLLFTGFALFLLAAPSKPRR